MHINVFDNVDATAVILDEELSSIVVVLVENDTTITDVFAEKENTNSYIHTPFRPPLVPDANVANVEIPNEFPVNVTDPNVVTSLYPTAFTLVVIVVRIILLHVIPPPVAVRTPPTLTVSFTTSVPA